MRNECGECGLRALATYLRHYLLSLPARNLLGIRLTARPLGYLGFLACPPPFSSLFQVVLLLHTVSSDFGRTCLVTGSRVEPCLQKFQLE